MSKKYIFLSCASNDDVDVMAMNALREKLIQKRLRIYQSQQNENINILIANGIENAALLIIFPSLAFQQSKACFKILNYADQKKTPILAVNHITFKPIGWLGVILAAYKACKCEIEDVMATIKAIQIKTEQILLKEGEKNENFIDESKPFFHGSTKDKNMVANYTQNKKKFPMDLEVTLVLKIFIAFIQYKGRMAYDILAVLSRNITRGKQFNCQFEWQNIFSSDSQKSNQNYLNSLTIFLFK